MKFACLITSHFHIIAHSLHLSHTSQSHVHHAIYASDHVSGVERLKEMYTMHGAGTTGWLRMHTAKSCEVGDTSPSRPRP